MSESWQEVTDEIQEETERLRVPGGWLYRTVIYDEKIVPVAVSMCFQPERAE
jgi:hypothetical protein